MYQFLKKPRLSDYRTLLSSYLSTLWRTGVLTTELIWRSTVLRHFSQRWSQPNNHTFWVRAFKQLQISQIIVTHSKFFPILSTRTQWNSQLANIENTVLQVKKSAILPWSFILSIIVINFFSLAIDSCSFPLLMKSVPKPGIIP